MPFNSSQSLDTDGDGILDNIDPDDDTDSRLDLDEVFNGNWDVRADQKLHRQSQLWDEYTLSPQAYHWAYRAAAQI